MRKITPKNNQTKKEEAIKYVDYSIIIINIGTNIALLFLTGDILNGFTYTSALSYNFTTLRYFEIAIFAIAQISGIYLLIKFFTKQNLKGKLLIITIPLTIILVVGLWFFYNAQNININSALTFSQIAGISDSTYTTIGFEYVLLAVLVYIILLYIIYGVIFKSMSFTKVKSSKTNKIKV